MPRSAHDCSAYGYNVIDYGAVGDGQTVNTGHIQKAIEDCAKAGGGTVYFPAGAFISGTLFLKSYVTLHLETGAILRGSKDVGDYPVTVPHGISKSSEFTRSLIYGEGLEYVGITGHGIIDGNSEGFFQDMQELRASDYMAWRKLRPFNVRLVGCEHVAIRQITLINACAWCVHFRGCRDLQIRGITLNNRRKGVPNADGIDLDSCENVRVSDCDITSSDDALVIFGKTSKNIVISNCLLSSHCHAFKMYSAGAFQNIGLNNCIIHDTYRAGVSLQMHNGCHLENLSISNVIMDRVKCAVWIQQSESPGHKPEGSVSNIIISNIQATNADSIGCMITGTPACPLKNVTLSNIRIACEGGGAKELAEREIGELPEHDENIFGKKLHQRLNNHNQFGMLPAYGFYCRHAEGLVMENIALAYESADYRPAVYFKDVKNARLTGLQASYEEDSGSMIVIDGSRNVVVSGCDATRSIGALARIMNGSSHIHCAGNITILNTWAVKKT
ncbi:MAG: right-handed parallel beta-helix repeat-containing protein [Lentisphaerae bacterium]|nr:right-handed parallel beta-helix repeat-containing protein [Lentisphaerota bacterium]